MLQQEILPTEPKDEKFYDLVSVPVSYKNPAYKWLMFNDFLARAAESHPMVCYTLIQNKAESKYKLAIPVIYLYIVRNN